MANTERHLDVSKGHSVRADDKTDELKKLNRSIFRPAITFNKDAKRAAQEAKLAERYETEREEREKAMGDIRETQNRLGRAATYGRGEDEDGEEGVGEPRRGRYKTEQQLADRKEQRKRYQFEATGSDDEVEDELDDNLDEIGDATKTLKALSMAMGQELNAQNSRIGRIEEKTVNLDNRVFRNTERVCLHFSSYACLCWLSVPSSRKSSSSSTILWKDLLLSRLAEYISHRCYKPQKLAQCKQYIFFDREMLVDDQPPNSIMEYKPSPGGQEVWLTMYCCTLQIAWRTERAQQMHAKSSTILS